MTTVSRSGRTALDTLSAQDKALLPPLPYGKASPAYRAQWIATISKVMEHEGMKCGVPVERADARRDRRAPGPGEFRRGTRVAVSEGLEGVARVVTRGAPYLGDGVPVEVVP